MKQAWNLRAESDCVHLNGEGVGRRVGRGGQREGREPGFSCLGTFEMLFASSE